MINRSNDKITSIKDWNFILSKKITGIKVKWHPVASQKGTNQIVLDDNTGKTMNVRGTVV
jgi:hypothetical protein